MIASVPDATRTRSGDGRQRPVVLLDVDDSLENFRESFPVLMAYFDAAYEPAATHVFDDRFGVTVLIRRGVRTNQTFEPLGWPCFPRAG